MMKKWLAEFAVILGVWLLLVWNIALPDIIAGVVIAAFLSFLFRKIVDKETLKLFNPVRFFWMLVYIPVFVYHMIVANFDVAYRVLNPGLPIKPGIVKVKTRLKSDIAKMFLANSITLTPGTLTVDIDGEYLYVHWIYVESEKMEVATEKIVQKFEKHLMRVFK